MDEHEESRGFAECHWNREILAELGLPDIGYPVPVERFPAYLDGGGVEFPELLYWLQVASATDPQDWMAREPGILALSRRIAPEDDREEITARGDDWTLVCGPVDLDREIVTIQRGEHLLAAISPEPGGVLRICAYRPLDARSARILTSLGTLPHPKTGLVNMRPNNWEYALDCSAGMGQVYASEAGESYLSYWECGLGVSASGDRIAAWFDQRDSTPLAPNLVATQIGVCYALAEDQNLLP